MYKNPYDKTNLDGRYVELQQVLDNVPDIENGNGKIALYVGASCSRAFLQDILLDFGYDVDIIEICSENIDCIKKSYKFRNLIHGDISEEKNITENYDLIFWYHGPEHVKRDGFCKINIILEKRAKMIVLGCPCNDQNTYEDNPNVFEQHLWKITPSDIELFGYKTSVVKREGAADNIVAWKKL